MLTRARESSTTSPRKVCTQRWAQRGRLKQASLALEEAAEDFGQGEDDVAMEDGGEGLLGQTLAEQRAALGLAGGAEVSGLATEGESVLAPAGGATRRLQPPPAAECPESGTPNTPRGVGDRRSGSQVIPQ